MSKNKFPALQEFWTSEDGTLISIVLPRPITDESQKQLVEHPAFTKEAFEPSRLKPRFAYREWVGKEFFDGGGGGQKRGKVWRLTDESTETPVFEYELRIPR